MAARKSCTHMTWAEAKGKSGDTGMAKKKGEKPKKLNHVEKIIAKNTTSDEDRNRERSQRKQEQRQLEKLQAMAEKKSLERQKLMTIPDVYPHEQAKERRKKLAEALATKGKLPTFRCDKDDWDSVLENREMQLMELDALEAIFADTDQYRVCGASKLPQLREVMEGYSMDPDAVTARTKAVGHPATSMLIMMDIEDEETNFSSTFPAGDGAVGLQQLVSVVMLRITLPPFYPSRQQEDDSIPSVSLEFHYASDAAFQAKADKPVETLVNLDEQKLLDGLKLQFEQTQPEFALYEVCVTWLTEHFYEYCKWNMSHPLLQSASS